MIVLHPNSACDVCLEGYDDAAPHTIACGHCFCLRCLAHLSRQTCPLCRTPFVNGDIRKLIVDRSNSVNNILPSSKPFDVSKSAKSVPEVEEPPKQTTARAMQDRLTRLVLDGGKANDVHDILEEVRMWLTKQPDEEYRDLRAARALLFKYTALQRRLDQEKTVVAKLNELCEDLTEKNRKEREVAEVKYQDLAQKRMDEMETAMSVERNLRERLDETEREWRYRYERCMDDYRRCKEELKRFKHNPLPSPPRSLEASYIYSPDSELVAEPMDDDDDEEIMVRSDSPKNTDEEEDSFKLSPIPPTATLPISNLPNRQTFRPLTAEDTDVEDFQSKRTSPYLLRSIDPIPIRPGVHRMNSSSSIMTRSGYDAAKSLPRSTIDVHMASCSSSPITTYQPPSRDRVDEPMNHDSIRTRARGATINSYMREHEEHQEHVRKLSDVLDRPSAPAPAAPPPPPMPPQFLKERRETQRSPDSSAPGTRTTSPVSPPGTLQSPLLQRPSHETSSRASTAALEAERARPTPHKEASMRSTPVAPPPTSPYKDRERDYPVQYPMHPQQYHPPQYPAQQYQPRRPSTGSIRVKQTSAPATASNLTRSLWGTQEPQRA